MHARPPASSACQNGIMQVSGSGRAGCSVRISYYRFNNDSSNFLTTGTVKIKTKENSPGQGATNPACRAAGDVWQLPAQLGLLQGSIRRPVPQSKISYNKIYSTLNCLNLHAFIWMSNPRHEGYTNHKSVRFTVGGDMSLRPFNGIAHLLRRHVYMCI